MTWDLIPGIRHANLKGCVDEQTDCDYEKVTLCAFNQSAKAETRVDFLECMDKTKVSTDALKAATPCASAGKLALDALTTCFNGAQGTALGKEASKVFNKALPGSTTIPHTFVGTKDVDPNYAALEKALCAAGSTASVCGGPSPPAPAGDRFHCDTDTHTCSKQASGHSTLAKCQAACQ